MGAVADRKPTVPPCTEDCPAGIDVSLYIRCIQHGDFEGALAVIREKIPFPAVCGYACVHPCEARCARIQLDEPVAIRMLKRAAREQSSLAERAHRLSSPTQKTVAVIGSGPCGLTAAYYLALLGHTVEVFDKDKLAGGMLRYAIPKYRLPEAALEDDLRSIMEAGVRFRGGENVSTEDLLGRYDAVLIASGNQLSKRLVVEGSELSGVFWGLDFLRSARRGEKLPVKDPVCVVGGGSVAIDAALSARRLGAQEIRVVCLEQGEGMPAHTWEIAQALEEGVTIENGWGPMVIHGREGHVIGMTCMRCVSLLDRDGRFNPRYDPSVTRYFEAGTVIFAIGQIADTGFINVEGVRIREGLIDVDDDFSTGVKGLFAAGEAITGPSSIIHAIAQGRRAAASLDKFLGGQGIIDRNKKKTAGLGVCEPAPRGTLRHRGKTVDVAECLDSFAPVELGYSARTAIQEALRCLGCDVRRFTVEVNPALCKECGYCREVCSLNVFAPSETFNPSGYRPVIARDTERCVGCLKCLYICPDFAVSIQNGGSGTD